MTLREGGQEEEGWCWLNEGEEERQVQVPLTIKVNEGIRIIRMEYRWSTLNR